MTQTKCFEDFLLVAAPMLCVGSSSSSSSSRHWRHWKQQPQAFRCWRKPLFLAPPRLYLHHCQLAIVSRYPNKYSPRRSYCCYWWRAVPSLLAMPVVRLPWSCDLDRRTDDKRRVPNSLPRLLTPWRHDTRARHRFKVAVCVRWTIIRSGATANLASRVVHARYLLAYCAMMI